MLNGRLYVMGGGVGAGDKLQELEMSEENGPSWIVKADLPAVREQAASAVVDGKLWLLGGNDEDYQETDSVFIYDPEGDTWTTGPQLPFTVGSGCATMHDGDVHLISQHGTLIYRGSAWLWIPGGQNDPTGQSLLLG